MSCYIRHIAAQPGLNSDRLPGLGSDCSVHTANTVPVFVRTCAANDFRYTQCRHHKVPVK